MGSFLGARDANHQVNMRRLLLIAVSGFCYVLICSCGGNGPTLSPPASPLVITSAAPPSGTVQNSYSFSLSASGGTPPYQWNWGAATGSSLPPGLKLSNASITGTPTAAGSYDVAVTVTDSAHPNPQQAAVNYNMAMSATLTWYVNGITGSDTNSCPSAQSACKTIGHAISLASSGNAIMVAAATYKENLTIGFSLTVIGAAAGTTIIDGGKVSTVVTISSARAVVGLSNLTIRNGVTSGEATAGGGIRNLGGVTMDSVQITGNQSCAGGGIFNIGVLTINQSTISGNSVFQAGLCDSFGAGIANNGSVVINRSTINGNTASGTYGPRGGGIFNFWGRSVIVNSSTISGNVLAKSGTYAGTKGGGIYNAGTLQISSSTITANGSQLGGNLYGNASIQNSIIANNVSGGDCGGTMTSNGYNLSSDETCEFTGPGDKNDINPMLGMLQNNGGPTQTEALLSGSPAIDAGNPSGCTDGRGRLLKTDQRGMPRPDAEDAAGCDIGAYERQTD